MSSPLPSSLGPENPQVISKLAHSVSFLLAEFGSSWDEVGPKSAAHTCTWSCHLLPGSRACGFCSQPRICTHTRAWLLPDVRQDLRNCLKGPQTYLRTDQSLMWILHVSLQPGWVLTPAPKTTNSEVMLSTCKPSSQMTSSDCKLSQCGTTQRRLWLLTKRRSTLNHHWVVHERVDGFAVSHYFIKWCIVDQLGEMSWNRLLSII